MALPEERQEFVADTRRYSGPLREAAKDADKFGAKNDQAALAARKMGLAAAEAADKAARAQKDAADAAERLAKGEISAAEAADKATRAEREVERASIKAAEAQRATADAADKAAANYRQMGRDAELSAAKQRLAALAAAGAVKQHNDELLRLRKTFPDLGKDASGAFKLMQTGGQQFGTTLDKAIQDFKVFGVSGPGVLAAVGVGLHFLPAAAAAAAGGITLGLGGALTLIGIKAQAGNAQVKREFADMRTSVVGELRQISAPFHDTLMAIPKDAQMAFDEIAPGLDHAFADAAPAVTRFAHQTASSMGELNPAIESVGRAFSRDLGALGDRMPAIMHNVSVAIEAVTDAAARNPQAIAGFVEGLSNIVRYTGDAIGFLVKYGSEIKTVLGVVTGFGNTLGLGSDALAKFGGNAGASGDKVGQLAGRLGITSRNMAATSSAAAGVTSSTTQTGMATRQLMTAQQAAAMSSTQLKNALDALTSANQNAFDSTTNYRAALLAANVQAKSNSAGINGMSKAAVANRQSLSQLASAIKDVETKSHPTAAAIATMRARFISAAEGMGVSRREAIALADKLLGVKAAADKIPKSKNTKVTATTSTAMSNLDRFLATVNRIPTRKQLSVDVRYNGLRPDLGATGGVYQGAGKGFRYAGGGQVSGLVSGPGSGTSDDVPAPWLSNGEFVVREKVTRENTAALMALNAGVSWMRAGVLAGERFAKGGKVKSVLHAPTKTAAAKFGMAKARPEELAAIAAQSALSSMRYSAAGAMGVAGLVGAGSAPGTTVMHVNVTLHVAGSIRSDRDIVRMVQQGVLTSRKAMNLPAGR